MLPDAASGQSPGTLASKLSRCKEGMARVFAVLALRSLGEGGPGTNFIEHYECRGTKLISGREIVSVPENWQKGTGAVSRYNLFRSQKFVKLQDFDCGQMRVSGCNGHYEFVLGAVAKAKTVTNNLPLLSVLAADRF